METKLWYKTQATSFTQALPIGNGSLGAMVYGKVPEEYISLNIDTLWSGTGRKQDKYLDRSILEEAKKLSLSGKYYEADKLVEKNLLGEYNESYMPLGILRYRYINIDKPWEYKRELDLEKAIVKTNFLSGDVEYTSEIFASYPARAIILSIRASKKSALNIEFALESKLKVDIIADKSFSIVKGFAPSHVEPNYVDSNNPIIYDENNSGMPFCTYMEIESEDGIITANSNKIYVKAASEIRIILTADTGYLNRKYSIDYDINRCIQACKKKMEGIRDKSYTYILQEHLNDYQKLFYKSIFKLESETIKGDTSERIKLFREGSEDLGLYCLYYHYGRYLLISSSRKGSEASNLQGIWSEELRPAWSSNFTININTQMNYWPAGVCNLIECYEPLLSLLKDLSVAGKETAKKNFYCEGWVANHNVDIWRSTKAVAGMAKYAFWPMGGVWLSTSLFEYYKYTRDKDLLNKEIYPILKGSAEFCLSWLKKLDDGYYHTPLSTSPENTFYDKDGRECAISYSSTMDIALIKELFKDILYSSRILKIEDDFIAKLKRVYAKLPPYKIGKDGKLQEWIEDFSEVNKGHRHFSPLFAFFPGTTISDKENEKFIAAVEKFIEIRLENGGGHTGWSLAWIINLYAKLGNVEKALKYLRELIANSSYDNLLDLHPPLGENEFEKVVFQIDGNFGGISGIANMLLKCINGKGEISKNLTKIWKKGSISGLLDFEGKEVNLEW
jgi:hypothetical protein